MCVCVRVYLCVNLSFKNLNPFFFLETLFSSVNQKEDTKSLLVSLSLPEQAEAVSKLVISVPSSCTIADMRQRVRERERERERELVTLDCVNFCMAIQEIYFASYGIVDEIFLQIHSNLKKKTFQIAMENDAVSFLLQGILILLSHFPSSISKRMIPLHLYSHSHQFSFSQPL